MKLLALLASIMLSSTLLAQSSTGIPNTVHKSKKKVKKKKKSFMPKNTVLTLEMGTSSVRDKKNDVQGNESYVGIEPGYRFTKKFNIAVGGSYKAREAGGTLKGAEKANRDGLENIYTKIRYNPTKFKKNGVADVRLQFRLYSDQDDFFKRRFGSNGNYQFRAYLGRPIYKGFYFSKFTNYFRYKNYFNNNHVSNKTRDYELRARVTPTYRLSKGTDLGLTFTYNHIFKVNKIEDEEELDIEASYRKQVGSYAVLLTAGTEYLNNGGGETILKRNEESGKTVKYAMILNAFY